MTKIKNVAICLVFVMSTALPLVSSASAMTCREFDALSGVVTHEDFKHTKWTGEQFQAFRTVIADHAGKIASLHRFSKRNEALQVVLKDKSFLAWVMSNSLSMTIYFCVDRPDEPMSDVAIEPMSSS